MSHTRNLLLAGVVLASTAGLARAEMAATTMTDIDVRSGPGQQYPAIGTATRGSDAVLDGCIEGSRWCRIDVNGMRGWVYAQYLSVEQDGSPVVVQEHSADLGVPVVTYQQTDEMSVGSVAPDVAQPGPNDELIGPVDQVDAITPPETVTTYVESNPVSAVQLQGDVVVGATLPQGVRVRTIPDYQYSYTRINGQQVLVDPGTHRIVYVYN
ncbi:DUF1236 domain-containing protein [Neorhizobium sp. P12A]|uniref:DUF1236 domain-containing protein n=1 Tax=Neorhizobium sp. P12A TaxID=2268027 RepID=UPI0011EC1D1A|nr:DUF1236 domain-containing protein [Neorhizobium sp. P12A]KAA0700461.1 DUF1236 domain-containing protein [Neorhizobium sp. P12A]